MTKNCVRAYSRVKYLTFVSMKNGQIFFKLCLGGMVLAVMAGCAGTTSTMSLTQAAYSTTFLGSDGRIIRDPRATDDIMKKLPQARKPKERTVTRTVGYAAQYMPVQPQGWWKDEGAAGATMIKIKISKQEALFYRGDRIIGMSAISTGRSGFETPRGTFKIGQKAVHYRSNLYGDYVDNDGKVVMGQVSVNRDKRPPGTRFLGAEMPYFMRINGPVGLHGGYLPGYADSHGCVRFPLDMVKLFYENAAAGTTVIVE